MKKIILIRHGKSSWDSPIEDHERPLSNKGIVRSNKVFDSVLPYLPKRFLMWSSTAKRAQDTAKIFSEVLNIPHDLLVLKNELYTFDEKALLKSIHLCENDVPNLILFGHNNAITEFVNKFGNKYIENVPTSGIVIIDFLEEKWSDIKKGITSTILFPKNLPNAYNPS